MIPIPTEATVLGLPGTVLFALVLVLGSFLRLHDLDAFRANADEGQYLFSARIQRLERDTGFAARLTEDAEWAWPKYYPHS